MKTTLTTVNRLLGATVVSAALGLAGPVAGKEANAVGSSKTTQQADGSTITCTVRASDGGDVKCVTRDANGNTTGSSTHHPRG